MSTDYLSAFSNMKKHSKEMKKYLRDSNRKLLGKTKTVGEEKDEYINFRKKIEQERIKREKKPKTSTISGGGDCLATFEYETYGNDEKKNYEEHTKECEEERYPTVVSPIFDKLLEYKGQTYGGVPFGMGQIIYPDGSYYIGEVENGKRHGIGKSVTADGKIYLGEFVDDKRFGKGFEMDDEKSFEYYYHRAKMVESYWGYNPEGRRGPCEPTIHELKEVDEIIDYYWKFTTKSSEEADMKPIHPIILGMCEYMEKYDIFDLYKTHKALDTDCEVVISVFNASWNKSEIEEYKPKLTKSVRIKTNEYKLSFGFYIETKRSELKYDWRFNDWDCNKNSTKLTSGMLWFPQLVNYVNFAERCNNIIRKTEKIVELSYRHSK